MTEQSTTKKVRKTDTTINQLKVVVGLVILVVIAIVVAFVFGAATMTVGQRWAFIAVLLVFPFFSIATIIWLILRHSKKLLVSQNDNAIIWEPTSPEKQKRKLNNEIRDLAEDLSIDTEQLSDLRSAYIVAEDLALRKIQNEVSIPLKRKIDVGAADFDALWVDSDLITCVEVTFVVTPTMDQQKINRLMRKTNAAKGEFEKMRKGTKVRLLLVIVTQLDEGADAELRSAVKANFKSTPVDVDIRFMDFLSLQTIYADD